MAKKNYNLGAQLVEKGLAPKGSPLDLDDMDVVEELGLDPKLAYTPALNEAALQRTRERTIRDLVEGGYEEKQARMLADKAMSEQRQLMKKVQKHKK